MQSYEQLNANLAKLFEDLQNDKVGVSKANALTKVAAVICNNQRNAILEKKVSGPNRPLPFFEEVKK